MNYEEIYCCLIDELEVFWGEEVKCIYWYKLLQQVFDYSNLLFWCWFVGGEINFCYNVVDCYLVECVDQFVLVVIFIEIYSICEIIYCQLYCEVNDFVVVFKYFGVGYGDCVVIYMLNMVEVVFVMLVCVCIGVVYLVVFGGFVVYNLVLCIDDVKFRLLIVVDVGMCGGKLILYKLMVDVVCVEVVLFLLYVLIVLCGLDVVELCVLGCDVEYVVLCVQVGEVDVLVQWLEVSELSYLLYIFGIIGKLKGVQCDVGGYVVVMVQLMEIVFDCKLGQVMFFIFDVGWVVGYFYNVYGFLIGGCMLLLYEGLLMNLDLGIWWVLCEQYNVCIMFFLFIVICVLKKYDVDFIYCYDLCVLKYLFLVGELLDEFIVYWISEVLGKLIIDNYWQIEIGWLVLILLLGLEMKLVCFGLLGFFNFGYWMKVIDENIGEEVVLGQKGVLVVLLFLLLGCMSMVWNDDSCFLQSYFSYFKELLYSLLDWVICDDDGYIFIFGCIDDVINVVGYCLGMCEIEEVIFSYLCVVEVVVIGVKDELKGQVLLVFVIFKQGFEGEDLVLVVVEMMVMVIILFGVVVCLVYVYVVNVLFKICLGKLLWCLLQVLVEQCDLGDLLMLDDFGVLEEICWVLGC